MKDIKLLFVLIIAAIFRLFILNFLPIKDVATDPVFITDLLGKTIIWSWQFNIIFPFASITLLWVILKTLFSQRIAFFASLAYAISPWCAYIEIAGSVYVCLLFLTLLFFFGLVLVNKKRSKVGLSLVFLSGSLLILSSIFFWVIVPVFLFAGVKIKFLPLAKSKILFCGIAVVIALSLILIPTHRNTFSNYTSSQLTILADVGLVNSVNTFRGETAKSNMSILGKIIENKYLFFSEKLVLNFIHQLSPAVYFTPQAKLLNFSFSPPIIFGLLLPFIFGLGTILQLFQKYQWILLSFLVLVIPSVFSKVTPNLTSLLIFSPVLFTVIGFGLEDFYINRKSKIFFYLMIITIALVVFQAFVVVSDIILREPVRLGKFG